MVIESSKASMTLSEDGADLDQFDWNLKMFFNSRRHLEKIEVDKDATDESWRLKERLGGVKGGSNSPFKCWKPPGIYRFLVERISRSESSVEKEVLDMKTVSVALVMCLNLGVDPPDVVKTQPCAKLECWIDSTVTVPPKITEVIGANLQKQYERWQPRARYKQSLDPTVDEVKKLCTSLRRNAKEERVLFHYNGHGVPKPTINGEIWVFNKERGFCSCWREMTSLFPFQISMRQSFVDSRADSSRYPNSIDCLGTIALSQTFTQYIPLSIYDLQTWMGAPSIYVYDCSNAGIIVEHFKHFAKQHEHEFEQMSPQGKSQVLEQNNGVQPCFRNCLQLAACSTNEVLPMNPELPADLFTACLTTPIKIALQWFVMHNTSKLVPHMTLEMIDKLPGQLNDRRTLMGELNWIFTAITDTIAWNSLPRDLFQRLFRQDLLVASLFRNFLLAERIMRSYNCCPVSNPKLTPMYQHPMWQAWDLAIDLCIAQVPGILERGEPFQCSPFFAEQLTAFQVWLAYGSEARSPPEQLPVVLQVLLSQVHRLRALELLGRFLDLGSWAVHLSLSVGIFPYVLKLLQSSARELSPLLVFIWAKILAVDTSCQVDLVRENGHKYFLGILEDTRMPSEHRMMAAFVLANIVSNYPTGQEAALKGNVIAICLEQLSDTNQHLRQWLAICLGRVWTDFDDARWCGVRDSAHEKLYCLLDDDHPEVRAAAVYALGTFMGCVAERSDHANSINHSIGIKLLNTVTSDGSPLVRKELVVALHYLVLQFENQFVAIATQLLEEERLRETCGSPQGGISASGVWGTASHDSNLPSSISGGRHVTPRDKMKLLHSPGLNTSNGSLDSTGSGDCSARSVRRVSSSSAVSIGLGLPIAYPVTVPFTNIFTRIWVNMVLLSADPHPEGSALASVVVGHVRSKIYTTKEPKEVADTKSLSSFSAPSSPSSKQSFIGSQSPPANMCSSDMQRSTSATGRSYLPARSRRVFDKSPGIILEETGEDCVAKTALVLTDYVDWCCTYMARPFMKHLDDMDPESDHYIECEWRYLRNARIRKDAECEQRRASTTRLDNQVFINRNANLPTCVRFHPYEPHLAVADKDCLSIWDWEQGLRLGHFPNVNAPSTRITAIDFINGHNHPLLLVGTDDGATKIWKNYTLEDGAEPELITAWQSLTDMLPSNRGAGLVLGWDQESGSLFASGDARLIRIWDCERELKLKDIQTGADSCVTSMSLDQSMTVCGFGDGSIRIYDRRCKNNDCRIATLREHAGWVVNLRLTGSPEHIISGCVTGDVKYWDTRKISSSVRTFATSQAMTAMAVHPMAEILACGSANQFVTVYTYMGDNLSIIKYHDGFMGQRIGPISCLDFHPHKVNLAAGSTDSLISVYAPERRF